MLKVDKFQESFRIAESELAREVHTNVENYAKWEEVAEEGDCWPLGFVGMKKVWTPKTKKYVIIYDSEFLKYSRLANQDLNSRLGQHFLGHGFKVVRPFNHTP